MAALLEKNFVPLKIDAEKGEGPEIAKRYGVRGFPTLLVVDSLGEEVDRIVGYRPPRAFISTLKPVLEGKSFAALKKRVSENPSDFEAVLSLGKKHEDRNDYPKAEEFYQRVLKAQDVPASLRAAAEGRLVLVESYKSRGQEVARVQEYLDRHAAGSDAVDHARLLFAHHQRKRNTPELIKAAEYLLRNGSGDDPEFLNNYAWYLATHDEKLKTALELARKAVELSPRNAHLLDTLAEAYHRNGRHREAVDTQRRAVQHASDQERAELEKRLEGFEKELQESEGKKTRRF